MRDKTVTIRLSDGEHKLIKSRSAKIGLTLADYMRMQTLHPLDYSGNRED